MAYESSGQGDSLSLSSRKERPARTDVRFVAVGKFVDDEFVRIGAPRGSNDFSVVGG